MSRRVGVLLVTRTRQGAQSVHQLSQGPAADLEAVWAEGAGPALSLWEGGCLCMLCGSGQVSSPTASLFVFAKETSAFPFLHHPQLPALKSPAETAAGALLLPHGFNCFPGGLGLRACSPHCWKACPVLCTLLYNCWGKRPSRLINWIWPFQPSGH